MSVILHCVKHDRTAYTGICLLFFVASLTSLAMAELEPSDVDSSDVTDDDSTASSHVTAADDLIEIIDLDPDNHVIQHDNDVIMETKFEQAAVSLMDTGSASSNCDVMLLSTSADSHSATLPSTTDQASIVSTTETQQVLQPPCASTSPIILHHVPQLARASARSTVSLQAPKRPGNGSSARPAVSEQRCIAASLQTNSTHLYAVSRSWWKRWKNHVTEGPQAVPVAPGPVEMDARHAGGPDTNEYLAEDLWRHLVNWYGLAAGHQLDRKHVTPSFNDDIVFEICTLSAYSGIVDHVTRPLNRFDEVGVTRGKQQHFMA